MLISVKMTGGELQRKGDEWRLDFYYMNVTFEFIIRYARRRAFIRPSERRRSEGFLLKKVAILIDGGHLRILARKAGLKYDPEFIETVAKACLSSDEDLLRTFYYDCPLFKGTCKRPVSGEDEVFTGNDDWLMKLASKDLFAIRLGVLKFRGYKPRKTKTPGRELTDEDFKPDFEQKGVDMRIGLDIAHFSVTRAVERIVLITNDTDCIPAMKYGRRAGLQIVLMSFPGHRAAPELLHHTDLHRRLTEWPDAATPILNSGVAGSQISAQAPA